MKYEYLTIDSEKIARAETDEINELAQQGWELVTAVPSEESVIRLYFKRPCS